MAGAAAWHAMLQRLKASLMPPPSRCAVPRSSIPHHCPVPSCPPLALPQKLCAEEHQKGIMGVDPSVPSTITSFPPGYIDKEKEVGAEGGLWVLGGRAASVGCWAVY